MRLARLELLRYGRHEGLRLAMPGGAHDFHLVVGPNEAGKSTIRAAITDLLYGAGAVGAGLSA
ncbi:MAG: AAA family ATPase [Burkholderiaceae bacterium]